jgi:hypothetical protein
VSNLHGEDTEKELGIFPYLERASTSLAYNRDVLFPDLYLGIVRGVASHKRSEES